MIVGKTFCKVPVFHYNSLHLRLLDGVFLPLAIFTLIRIADIPLSFTNTGEAARHKKCRICTFIVSSQFPHSISCILQVVLTSCVEYLSLDLWSIGGEKLDLN